MFISSVYYHLRTTVETEKLKKGLDEEIKR